MKRDELIKELIEGGCLRTKRVINAFMNVPREDFVLPEYRKHAYVNEPLPTMSGQTISQPLTIAVMTEALDVKLNQKILEVGAGSGYQAALLSQIAGNSGKVITTEIIPELFEFAKVNLKEYRNVFVVNADGSLGYEKENPYDRIIVTASAPDVPEPLISQLKSGGKMVITVGDKMFLVEKHGDSVAKKFLGYFAFVPLRGKHGHPRI